MSFIDNQCNTIYNGVLLNSYVWIIVSAILFQIVNFIATAIIIPYCKQLYEKLKSSSGSNKELNKRDKAKLLVGEQEEYSAGLAFLWYQILISYFGFISAIIVQSDSNKSNGLSNWTKYNNVYGLYINSVALTPVITVLYFLGKFWIGTFQPTSEGNKVQWELDFPEEASKILRQMGFLSYLPLVPAIYTHIIPGLIYYFWIILVALLLFLLYCVIIRSVLNVLIEWTGRIHVRAESILFQVGFRICCMLLFQTLYNYMSATYLTSDSYSDIIVSDYYLRSQTACIIHHQWDNMRNALTILNWVG